MVSERDSLPISQKNPFKSNVSSHPKKNIITMYGDGR